MAQGPHPRSTAWSAVARCVAKSFVMLGRGEVHLPRRNVATLIRFADETTGRVYRETVVDKRPADPCVLVVSFRLRLVRGRGHTLFRLESILNTPLFVGFPGFISKLWMAHDVHGIYRGLYEWDRADQARQPRRARPGREQPGAVPRPHRQPAPRKGAVRGPAGRGERRLPRRPGGANHRPCRRAACLVAG